MADTVYGASGVPVTSHAVVECVTDTARVLIPFPNMEETTALYWDQMPKLEFATATIVQVRGN